MDASRDANLVIYYFYDLCCARPLFFFFSSFRAVWGGRAFLLIETLNASKPPEESFNQWGGCCKTVPDLGRDGMKIAPPGDIFDQPSCERGSIRSKIADHAGDDIFVVPEELFW